MLNAVAPPAERCAGSMLRSPRAAPTGAQDPVSRGVPQRPPRSCSHRAARGAGLASGPGVLRVGVRQEELARLLGLLRIRSLAAGPGQGPCCPGAAPEEVGREERKESPPWSNAESWAFGEGLEARSGSAGRPRPGPSQLACVCVWHRPGAGITDLPKAAFGNPTVHCPLH